MHSIPDNQPHDFVLAENLPPGPHEVEIYKRSETQTGITQFLGFAFPGGKTLPPPQRQARKIEVMGDSFATGFGVGEHRLPGVGLRPRGSQPGDRQEQSAALRSDLVDPGCHHHDPGVVR